MGIQDVLVAISVLVALGFLVDKLFLEPRARAKGPHVTTRSLVRRARAKKKSSADTSCH